MTLPWHLAYPDVFDQIKGEVKTAYPDLHFSIEEERVVIHGSFPIVEGRSILDRYSIEVRVPNNFPKDLPIVWEVGGRIPWVAERHVDGDGKACLFVPDERWRYFPQGATLRDFLEGPVRNFFISQSVFERTGNWPFGQRSHGSMGILEAYGEMLEIPTEPMIVSLFLALIAGRFYKGHWPCPCGRSTIFRKCHRPKVWELRDRIGAENANLTLEKLIRDLNIGSITR